MRRPTLNLLVDIVAFLGFVLLTTTGVLLRYVLPPGIGRFTTLFGLDRHGWGDVHFWISIVFFGTLALHLLLHWKWIASVMKGRKAEGAYGGRVALAVVGLAALIALAAAPFVAPVARTGAPGGRMHLSSDDDQPSIRGSQTLREVADSAGMPLAELITQLGLPADVDENQKLGRLSQSYGFTIAKVRQVVDEYKQTH